MNPLINNKEIREKILQDPILVLSDLGEHLEISTSSYSEEDLREADTEQLDEIRETLCQLGYQPEKPETEANLYGLLQPLTEFKRDMGLPVTQTFSVEDENTLASLVELEGDHDVELSERLDHGSRGIHVRVLQYRLLKLGFYHDKIDGIYGKNTLQAVALCKLAFGLVVDRSRPGLVDQHLFETIGNPYELNRLILQRLNGQPILISNTSNIELEQDLKGHDRVFVCLNLFRFEEGLSCKSIDQTRETIDTTLRRTAIHLLQLQLWMSSIYLGRLDGLFGNKSMKALIHFLQENMLPVDKYLVSLKNGYWAIAPAIFEAMGTERPDPSEALAHESHLSKEVEEILKKEEKLQLQGKEKRETVFRRAWKSAKRLFRRLYKGFKSVIVRAGKAIARGARFFWRTLGDRFGSSALHVMSQMLARIKKALSTFWQNLKILYTFLKSHIVYTKESDAILASYFFGDFDVLNYQPDSNKGDFAHVRRHILKVHRQADIFATACDVVGTAMTVVARLITGPVGWLRLALSISGEVLEKLRDLLVSPKPAVPEV
jgi:peptidoglycan hydrolase-like protein with peptidoglycan-binding domain